MVWREALLPASEVVLSLMWMMAPQWRFRRSGLQDYFAHNFLLLLGLDAIAKAGAERATPRAKT